MNNLKIHHVGYAVKRLERAQSTFEELGFEFGEIYEDCDRNLRIVFGEKDGYRVELVCPQDKNLESPVDQYISNFPGSPYHICYQSDNLDNTIEELTRHGFKTIIEPRPAIAFSGKRVVFMMSLAVGLIEVVEE